MRPPARELDRRLIRFGPAIGKKDLAGKRMINENLCQPHLRFGIKEIRAVL